MAIFKFTLQQVLSYRGQLKEQAQVNLARAQAELSREQQRAAELRDFIKSSEDRLYAIGVSDMGERWLLEHFVKGLRADEASTHKRLKMLMAARDEAQKELALKARDEKILDKLKEKQAARFATEERLKEMRIYDETAAIRYKASSL